MATIQYIRRKHIDTIKWDACIDKASNGLIYGHSFYLDHMAKHWDALVLSNGHYGEHDYDAVMPLPWNSKYGIRYIYQPFLSAQLGVFGKTPDKLSPDFINAIPSSFRLVELSMNTANDYSLHAPHIEARILKRSN